MRHLLILFALICARVLAGGIILSASYAFTQSNSKNYVYVAEPSTRIRLTVTIMVGSYAKDGPLHVSFLGSEGDTGLPIIPNSSCISDDHKEVFSHSGETLFATTIVTTPTACIFNAEAVFDNTGVEFTGMDVAGQRIAVFPFTTASSSFQGDWAHPLVRAGETSTLTIVSNIPFDAEDIFTITASNGAPFLGASACRSTNNNTPLFSVSAQGSRMLFSSRTTVVAPFSCAVEVVIGPTTVTDAAYMFLAPAHGLALPAVAPLLSVLDHGDLHPRIGIVGVKLSVFGRDTFSSASSPFVPPSSASVTKEAVAGNADKATVDVATAPPAVRARLSSAFHRRTASAAAEANVKAKARAHIIAHGLHTRRTQVQRAAAASKLRASLTTHAIRTAHGTHSPPSATSITTASEDVPTSALYVGIPAFAVRMGDTIKLYYSRHRGLAMGDCTHKNGTVIGTHRLVFEDFATTDSFVTSYIILKAPPHVNEDGLAELYCHFTVVDYHSYNLAVTAVGVDGRVFSAYEKDTNSLSLRGYNLYNSGAFGSLAAYSSNLVTFQLTIEHPTTSPYVHFDVDFSLQGFGIKDIDDFYASCEGYTVRNQGYEIWRPSDVTVADGEVRMHFDTSTIAPDIYYSIACLRAAAVGQHLALYDHLLDAPLMTATVRPAVFSLNVNAGEQTHVLSRDAVAQAPLLPFSLTIRDMHTQLGQALRYDGVYFSIFAADVGLVLELPGVVLACSSGEVWMDQKLEGTYASLSLLAHGFDASCSGLASLQGFVGGDGSQNIFSVNMMQGNAAALAFPAVTRTAYSAFISTPKVVTAQQFSFLCPSVTLGTAATCTLGHALLQPMSSLTLTFDHDLVKEAGVLVDGVLPCTVAGVMPVTVLKCTVADKRVLTCVKQTVQTTTKCTMLLTFAQDFARNITATVSFSALPEGMVFAPTFAFPAASGAAFVLTAVSADAALTLAFTVGRPLPTDTVRLRFTLSDAHAGQLLYSYFYPSVGSAHKAATKQGGDWVISLAALDVTNAATQPIRIMFLYVPEAGPIVVPHIVAEAWYNDASLGRREITLEQNPAPRITYVPHSTKPLLPVVRFTHAGLPAGGTISLIGVSYRVAYPPMLVCGDYAPIIMENMVFTISTPIPATVPCYMRLQATAMDQPYWTVSSNSIPMFMLALAAGPNDPMVVPAVSTSTYVYAQGHSTAYAFVVRDFTTALLTENAALTFTFDVAIMIVGEVSCALDTGAVAGVVDAGVVTVTFSPDDRPIEEIGPMTCTLSLTPLIPASSAAFTSVSVLGIAQPNHPLPPFLAAFAPTITLNISGGASVCAAHRTPVPVQITLTQLAFTEGATLTFSSPLVPVPLEFAFCVDAERAEDGIRLKSSQPRLGTPTTLHCQAYVHYLSDAPVMLTATLVSGDTAQSFLVVAPPAYATNFHITRVSVNAGQVSYLVFVRDGDLIGRTASNDVELKNASPFGGVLNTDCPNRREYLSDTWVPYQYVFPEGVRNMTCYMNVTFSGAYDPLLTSLRPRLEYFDYSLNKLVVEHLPTIMPASPTLLVRVGSHSVHFTFSGVDAGIVAITNAWGLRASATNPVLLYSDDDGAVVGQLVADNQDHSDVLIATFVEGIVSVEDDEYTLRVPCYFNTTGMHGQPLFVSRALVDFTAGAHSTRVQVTPVVPRVQSTVMDSQLVPGSPYSVSMSFAVTGSDALLTIGYNNTALAAVEGCSVRVDGSDAEASLPVAITRDGSSFALAVSQEHTYAVKDVVVLALQCVFATLSDTETQRVVPRTNALTVSMVTTANVQALVARVPVAQPSFRPKAALTHTVSFPRSMLFNATEISALAQTYTSALRSIVAGLGDDQVVVSSQRLYRALSSLSVPSPLRTLFSVTADDDTIVIVGFTITSTDAAPVTTMDISAVTTILEEAFTAAGYMSPSLGTPDETVVDGECAHRCGLGCALCEEGDFCSAHVDCIDMDCSADGKCGTKRNPPIDPSDPDNAAHTATVVIATVLAVIVAAMIA